MVETWVNNIVEKEGLQAGPIEVIPGGHINLIFRAGGFIIRAARLAEDRERLQREGELYQLIQGQTNGSLPVPEILAMGELEGHFYQIQRELSGDMLHRQWLHLTHTEKETIMAQLGSYIEMMHQISFDTFGWVRAPEVSFPTWPAYVESFFRAALEAIGRSSIGFSKPLINRAERFLEERLPFLEVNQPVLVHADLWPGNILVDGTNITAILDFEFAHKAPRDYELVLIEDFCLYPNDFIEPELRMRSITDYYDFFTLLMRNSPGLFGIPNLRERLELYHVFFNMQLYHSWIDENPGKEENDYLVAKLVRITNMIYTHGSRMFIGWNP